VQIHPSKTEGWGTLQQLNGDFVICSGSGAEWPSIAQPWSHFLRPLGAPVRNYELAMVYSSRLLNLQRLNSWIGITERALKLRFSFVEAVERMYISQK